jgi:hypothetical protein
MLVDASALGRLVRGYFIQFEVIGAEVGGRFWSDGFLRCAEGAPGLSPGFQPWVLRYEMDAPCKWPQPRYRRAQFREGAYPSAP